MLMDILAIALIVYLIVRHVKKRKNENRSSTSKTLNIDNDYFLIKGGRLIEYRGKEDTIFVPRGVTIIGWDDKSICDHTIHTIYMPNSVCVIADCALPCVECVYYEGPKEKLHYDEEYNFQACGWTPDWAKKSGINYRVNEVKFHYNDSKYDMLAKAYFEKHPNALAPGSNSAQ